MLLGFLSRPAVNFNPATDIPDLTGKVIAITGGTSSFPPFQDSTL
jgi:hypothetical protein